jgi:hypothetical protein
MDECRAKMPSILQIKMMGRYAETKVMAYWGGPNNAEHEAVWLFSSDRDGRYILPFLNFFWQNYWGTPQAAKSFWQWRLAGATF